MMKREWVRGVRVAVLGGVAAAGVFFAGVYVARATPGGEVRRALSFSGTLTGRTGPQTLVFTFRKGMTAVCAPVVTATPDATTGAINMEIPLAACPTTLFDGADVTFEVTVGSVVLSPAQPVNPVPYAAYADRVGTPACPNGYERFTEAGMPAQALYCRKGADEVVRVGSGTSVFWIDRYLNSIWSNADGTGTQYIGTNSPVLADGSWTTPAYAVSRAGVAAAGFVTWRQANSLCRLVGKTLPTVDEFYGAAQGVPCRFGATIRPDECPGARRLDYNTGTTPLCISRWGAEQLCAYRFQWTRVISPGTGGEDPAIYFGTLNHNLISGHAGSVNDYYGFRCMLTR